MTKVYIAVENIGGAYSRTGYQRVGAYMQNKEITVGDSLPVAYSLRVEGERAVQKGLDAPRLLEQLAELEQKVGKELEIIQIGPNVEKEASKGGR